MLRTLCIAALFFVLSGCGSDSPSGPGQGAGDAAYYPLSVGNQWIYDRDGGITVGGITTTTISGMEVTEITGMVPHGLGFDVYVQDYSITDTIETIGQTMIVDTTYTTYVRITDQGFYSYGNLFESDSSGFVPFPLQVGATWQFSENPPMTAEILSLSESVTVPAGSFDNCLELRLFWIESGNTLENVTDFAPNVGRVRNVYTQSYEAVVTTVTTELMSYSVN